ncbi:MAG: hypothetical protein OHK0013_09980 [Sandaracinaceae bacterium]
MAAGFFGGKAREWWRNYARKHAELEDATSSGGPSPRPTSPSWATSADEARTALRRAHEKRLGFRCEHD